MQTECGVQLILLAGLSLMGGGGTHRFVNREFSLSLQMPVHTPEDAIS